MSKLTVVTPVQVDRLWLANKALDIELHLKRAGLSAIAIGATLEEVRRTIGHGRYLSWVESSLSFGPTQAKRYRAVARAFAGLDTDQLGLFDDTALFLLAQPKGVKPEVRAHAVMLAGQGERITYTLAKQLIDAHRPVPDLTRGELKRYDDLKAGLNKREVRNRDDEVQRGRGGAVLVADPDAETERLRARDAAEHESIGRLFVRALREFRMVKFERLDDAERDDAEPEDAMFAAVAYREDDTPKTRSQADPRILLEQLLNVVRTKRCNGGCCPTPLDEVPLAEFCKNVNEADGRNPRCRKCERERKRQKRAEKKQQQTEGE